MTPSVEITVRDGNSYVLQPQNPDREPTRRGDASVPPPVEAQEYSLDLAVVGSGRDQEQEVKQTEKHLYRRKFGGWYAKLPDKKLQGTRQIAAAPKSDLGEAPDNRSSKATSSNASPRSRSIYTYMFLKLPWKTETLQKKQRLVLHRFQADLVTDVAIPKQVTKKLKENGSLALAESPQKPILDDHESKKATVKSLGGNSNDAPVCSSQTTMSSSGGATVAVANGRGGIEKGASDSSIQTSPANRHGIKTAARDERESGAPAAPSGKVTHAYGESAAGDVYKNGTTFADTHSARLSRASSKGSKAATGVPSQPTHISPEQWRPSSSQSWTSQSLLWQHAKYENLSLGKLREQVLDCKSCGVSGSEHSLFDPHIIDRLEHDFEHSFVGGRYLGQ